jgi:hypothetical protein
MMCRTLRRISSSRHPERGQLHALLAKLARFSVRVLQPAFIEKAFSR